jgi:plasmid maintenance system antidote protein VapI
MIEIKNRAQFIALLKSKMAESSISQNKLSKISGVSQTRISEFIAGNNDLTSDKIFLLADALNFKIIVK